MAVSIDLARYRRLPSDVRMRFDGWLKAEHIADKRIVLLTLTEGEVVVERQATGEDGKVIFDRSKQEVVTEITRYPVRSLPPREVFYDGGSPSSLVREETP